MSAKGFSAETVDANLAGLAEFLSGFYRTRATLDRAAIDAAGSGTQADLVAIFKLVGVIAEAKVSRGVLTDAEVSALMALCERAFVFEVDAAGAETMRLRRADEAGWAQ
jgi:hypothetical protein